MSIETTLRDALNDDAALTALIGSKVYANVAGQKATVPYITYQLITTTPHNKLTGAPGSERKVLQVNCISNSYANAKAIAEAAKAAINVSVGYLNGEGDDYFEKTQNHRVRLDFALIG